jgi:hypothetical protein
MEIDYEEYPEKIEEEDASEIMLENVGFGHELDDLIESVFVGEFDE